jgi:hypothetical protein
MSAIIKEYLVSGILENALTDLSIAVEEIGLDSDMKPVKKADLPALVMKSRLEGADTAFSVIMGQAYQIAKRLNDSVFEDAETEELARLLAEKLRYAPNETKRVVASILEER